jgi:membrane fusion protein, multidrug efflux system
MSTRISGTVRKVDVNDFESVKPDQLLVELDDADYRAMLEEAKAGLAGAKVELKDNQAAKRIQDAKIQSAEAGVIQATAAVNAAKAGVDAVRSKTVRGCLMPGRPLLRKACRFTLCH